MSNAIIGDVDCLTPTEKSSIVHLMNRKFGVEMNFKIDDEHQTLIMNGGDCSITLLTAMKIYADGALDAMRVT